MDTNASVLKRYSEAAESPQAELCCPVSYNSEQLKLLPDEIIEKDYGCGDPSRYVRPGDTVLDLGCGGGKICYLAAQLVGSHGRVIGVDMNDDMLALARKHQTSMASKLGGNRVSFHKAYIQDLALDLDAIDSYLQATPVKTANDYTALQDWQEKQRRERPLIADNSIDLVVSNCVLNLVGDQQKQQLVQEIHRVLKPGGRVAISDIVSDEVIPHHLKDDAQLWSGCLSGAFQEQEFIRAFVDAGFLGATYDKWDAKPWRTVEGIEFRSVTLTALKDVGEACLDYGHAVLYRGPFKSVFDDEGHEFPRGERMAVCEQTYKLLTTGPYKNYFVGISPAQTDEPRPWCAPAGTRRSANETKNGVHSTGENGAGCC